MTIDLGIDGLSEVEELGRGGSARVFKAWQVDLARPVAVKVLNSSWDEAVSRRFDRERKAMGRLSSHSGIVDIYATGATADGASYLIMPYYRRGSLEDLINIEGPQPWRTATSLMASAAATMADAHRLGIVHRDLKPANILIGDDSFPKIADFGISALVDHHTVTMTSGLTFTPSYSPPEAFASSAATTQRDVYGLGATLWSLLAGRAPFSSAGERVDLQHLIGRVMNEPVADLRPAVPDGICRVIEKAMAKHPEDRQLDAAAFVTELGHAIGTAESAEGVHTQTIEAAAPLTPPRITPPSAPPVPPVPLVSPATAAAAAQLGVPDLERREPFFAEQPWAAPELVANEPAAHQLPAQHLPAQQAPAHEPASSPRGPTFGRSVPLIEASGRTQRRSGDLGLVLKIAAGAALFLALFGAGAFALTRMGDDPKAPTPTDGSIPSASSTPTTIAPSSTPTSSPAAQSTATSSPSTTVETPPPTTAKQVTPTNPATPRPTDPPNPPTEPPVTEPPVTDPPVPPKCPTWNPDCIAG